MADTETSRLGGLLNWAAILLGLAAVVLLGLLGVRKLGQDELAARQPAAAGPESPAPNLSAPDQDDSMPVLWTDAPLGSPVLPEIRVDKSMAVLTVLDLGQPIKSYRVRVGSVSGDKQVEGDRKTPEGRFFVCLKQGRGQTRFTRALGLSYPNAEDAERGLAAGLIDKSTHDRIVYEVDRGRQPPWNTALGGEILIHGPKREDNDSDTLGCIRLEMEDILELFPAIQTGTVVVIQP
jgi:hypothetical protein